MEVEMPLEPDVWRIDDDVQPVGFGPFVDLVTVELLKKAGAQE